MRAVTFANRFLPFLPCFMSEISWIRRRSRNVIEPANFVLRLNRADQFPLFQAIKFLTTSIIFGYPLIISKWKRIEIKTLQTFALLFKQKRDHNRRWSAFPVNPVVEILSVRSSSFEKRRRVNSCRQKTRRKIEPRSTSNLPGGLYSVSRNDSRERERERLTTKKRRCVRQVGRRYIRIQWIEGRSSACRFE